MELRVGISQAAIEQWGFEETETKTIAFPISFESIKYVFLSKIYGPASGGADTVAYNFFRKSLTGVSFDYAYTRNWLAIGGQQPQWGIVYAEQGYIIVTLPLAYSSNKYVVIGQDLDYTSNDTDGYGENVGVTQVTTTSIRVSITRGRYLSYCTIGF